MMEELIEDAYQTVVETSAPIPYTEDGVKVLCAKMRSILGDVKFKAIPLLETPKDVRDSRRVLFTFDTN